MELKNKTKAELVVIASDAIAEIEEREKDLFELRQKVTAIRAKLEYSQEENRFLVRDGMSNAWKEGKTEAVVKAKLSNRISYLNGRLDAALEGEALDTFKSERRDWESLI